jgi:cobalt-zinc-cadmium efflux system membrane fusion protein
MNVSKKVLAVLVLVPLAAGVGAGFVSYPWLFAKAPEEKKKGEEPSESVKISAQARANLGIVVKKFPPRQEKWSEQTPATLPGRYAEYWRTLKVPGKIVEREGNCDRLVSARVAGVVRDIARVRGDLVKPGAALFTLEIVSEPLQSAQTGYYKNSLDLDIVAALKKRLEPEWEVLPVSKRIEIDNHEKKLERERNALEHELKVRGLTPAEIAGVKKGNFVTKITINAPLDHSHAAAAEANGQRHSDEHGGLSTGDFAFELEELKVKLGEQVQPGQALCQLAHHYRMQIEGRAFETERGLLQKAAKEGKTVWAEFPQQAASLDWPDRVEKLTIAFFDNKVDPHQTLNFYVPLVNEFHPYARDGKNYRLWRFRPGQRAFVHIPVQKFENVYAFPADAVIQDGPDAYVFRENGEAFQRHPVHVRYADRHVVLVADEGEFRDEYAFAMNAAAQLNWAFKAQSGGDEGGGHSHDH